ncbi:AgmX/PglI C-terminal domain-containing protein [bacterium]|nr:AgmX/PglI C-terminal domain-containing protein [bacterium]
MEAKSNAVVPLRLDVIGEDGKVLHASEFVKEKIVLGRILSADVRIDDPRVSRIHALIEVRDGTVLVTDLASSHGTYVNGKKVVESKLSFGDTLRLGYIDIKVSKGSGVTMTSQPSFEGQVVQDAEATRMDMHVQDDDKTGERRRPADRRKKDAFPAEHRMDDRRAGDRRNDERTSERRRPQEPGVPPTLPAGVDKDRRSGMDRRSELDYERRLGDRRRGDRRVFDITSLERRIEDRRTRRGDDDLLPEELEKAFEAPEHAREIEVTALWGDHILDVSNYHDPVVLTVGESPSNEYIIPSEGIPEEFPLITIEEDGGAFLAFTDEMSGTVRARDRIYSLKDLREEKFVKQFSNYHVVSLKQDDFAKVSIGNINFFMLYVRPAPRIKAAPLFENDAVFVRSMIGSFLVLFLMFLGATFIEPAKPVTIEMVPERIAKIVVRKKPKIPDAIVAKNEEAKQGGSVKGEGGRAPEPEGEAGKPDAPKKPEKPQAMAPKSEKKPDPAPVAPPAPAKPAPPKPTRKVVDQTKAKKVGMLEALSRSGIQKDLKNLINSTAGNAAGFEDFDKAVSGMKGQTIEQSAGAGGKGLKGVDVGGGGKTIGIDGPSTKGLGRGYEGDGIGEGISGPGRLGQKGEHSVNIVSENVQVLSGLPKDVINEVVQRHRSEIRACYDAALQRNPGLRGKVVVAFNIAPNGIVQTASVKESTLGDAGLGNCIVSRVKSWVFPKPEAPVVTEVSAYPFYLNPAN